ncbi:MAG: hypothetical protein WA919_16275 [Coleofasciculaceae cyanobacterium]
MKTRRSVNKQQKMLVLLWGSLLISFPAIPRPSLAVEIAQANPCPSIFYDPRFIGNLPSNCPAVSPSQPPLPGQQQAPSTTITPINGKVSVKLINETNAQITYQVVGETETRTLFGKSDVTLQGLNAPVTVTFDRPDGGLLRVNAKASDTSMLEVILRETTNLGVDKSALTIQEDGTVFLN